MQISILRTKVSAVLFIACLGEGGWIFVALRWSRNLWRKEIHFTGISPSFETISEQTKHPCNLIKFRQSRAELWESSNTL
jgi:hypothetical protein